MDMKTQDSGINKYDIMTQRIPTLPPLSGEIMALFMPHHPRHTLSDIVHYTKSNRSTVKRRVSELIRAGFLRKHGKGKATWYTL